MISKRLKYIIDIMDNFEKVADIGCDHGYVSVGLIEDAKANQIISSDISKQSLQKAIDYVKQKNLEDKIQLRVGSGLSILETDEVDAVVIAGMGGVLISDILKNDYNKKFISKNPILILQPVQQPKDIRQYLYENNFDILDEHIIEDMDKVYQIIVAKKCNEISSNYIKINKYKDVYMEYGIINIEKKSTLLKDIILKQIEKNKILSEKLVKNDVSDDYIQKIVSYSHDLEEVYETL